MRKTLTVAWREFRHTAMTKAFLFGAIIMPILMMGLFIVVIPLMMESNNTPLQGKIAVIGSSDVIQELQEQLTIGDTQIQNIADQLPDMITNDPIANAVLNNASSKTTDVKIIPAKEKTVEELKELVQEGELAGFIVIPESLLVSTDSEDRLEVFIPSSFFTRC